MKGRGTIVFWEHYGSVTGIVELAGAWVHFLPDARPHEKAEDICSQTFNYQAVHRVDWAAGEGVFAAPADVTPIRRTA